MDIRETIIQRIQNRITRTRAAFERFDDAAAELQMVGPKWCVRDLTAHLLHWIEEGTAQIPLRATGRPAPAYDLNRINDEVYRKNRRMSFAFLLPRLREAEERFIAAVRTTDPKGLIDSKLREWIETVGIEHYDHHWPGLKAAADRL